MTEMRSVQYVNHRRQARRVMVGNRNSLTLGNNSYFTMSSVEGVSFQPRGVPTGPVTFTLIP